MADPTLADILMQRNALAQDRPSRTYGAMGEPYDIEYVEPPPIGAMLARSAPAKAARFGMDAFLKDASRRPYENMFSSMAPSQQSAYLASLSPYERAMHYITWTPKGWPEILSPGHLALQAGVTGGLTYGANKLGAFDPLYDIADQVHQNYRLVKMLEDVPGASRDAMRARVDAARLLRNEPVAGNGPY